MSRATLAYHLAFIVYHSSFSFVNDDSQFAQTDARDATWLRTVARGRDAADGAPTEAERALAALYDAYAKILFGLLLRILHSRTEAEDVLQEVFVQVWQRAADFDAARGRPFTWLVTLARSRAIDRLRANASRDRTAAAVEDDNSQAASENLNPLDEAVKSERRERIREALNEIPEAQRRVLLLAYFEGLTQSEIAAKLNEPLGTVKTRTRSALFRLRELLQNKVDAAST